jgi:hypothetical protein
VRHVGQQPFASQSRDGFADWDTTHTEFVCERFLTQYFARCKIAAQSACRIAVVTSSTVVGRTIFRVLSAATASFTLGVAERRCLAATGGMILLCIGLGILPTS